MTNYESVQPNELDYFEGTRTIAHEDGSTTYIQYTHEPYVEPLTPKQQAAVLGAAAAGLAGIIVLPFMRERLEEWSSYRRERRVLKKEQKLAKLADEKPSEASPTD